MKWILEGIDEWALRWVVSQKSGIRPLGEILDSGVPFKHMRLAGEISKLQFLAPFPFWVARQPTTLTPLAYERDHMEWWKLPKILKIPTSQTRIFYHMYTFWILLVGREYTLYLPEYVCKKQECLFRVILYYTISSFQFMYIFFTRKKNWAFLQKITLQALPFQAQYVMCTNL